METPTLMQLRYFLAVADELHFGRAAERIGIAQPPLTQQIQKLERVLGCQLLVRGRKTYLTAAGVQLAEDAGRLLEQAENVFERTRGTALGEVGQLRVGVPPSVMLTELPNVIRRYRERYAAVGFTLREMATSKIEEALRTHEIDLGFLRESRPETPLRARVFLVEKLVAVFPAKHILASRPNVALGDLKSEPFILFPPRLGPAFHGVLVGACVSAGFTPNVVQEATQWQTVVSFVEAGMGVSIAPECVSKFRRPGVVYRALARLRTTVFASWSDDNTAPAVDRFLELAGGRVLKPAHG